jgi:beta-barrel assembly-enhancing protease
MEANVLLKWTKGIRILLLMLGMMIYANAVFPPAAEAFLISTQQEIELGKGVAKDLEKKYGLVNDPELQARVTRLGMSIAAVSDRKDMPYTFKVLNSKEVNALAVPGGYIYLFKGLVDYMPSDHELAGIIGHEVGHIVKKHTVVQIERSMAVGIIFAVLFGNSNSAILGDLIGSALMSGYSREAEREADTLGVTHTMRAGYNPYSMLIGMEKLDAMSGKSEYGLFSSHPDTANRVKAAKEQIINDYKVRPIVNEGEKSSQVVDGAWSLPAFYSKYAGYSPRMRAYLTAGKIYRLTTLADYSSDKLYINDMENATGIYYNDDKEPVAVVTPQDAAGNSLGGMNEMAQQIIAKIRERAGR